MTAIHDAIALANLFYAMPAKSSSQITEIFEQYQTERTPAVLESFENSRLLSKMMDRGITGMLVLFIVSRMPMWMWRLMLRKTVRYRPQIGFAPAIPLKGTVVPFVSPSEQKARAVYGKQKEHAATSL